jgi:hypothetical protein
MDFKYFAISNNTLKAMKLKKLSMNVIILLLKKNMKIWSKLLKKQNKILTKNKVKMTRKTNMIKIFKDF